MLSPATSGFFYCRGECFKQLPPTTDHRNSDDAGSTARSADGIRANDADGYKSWLAIGIEELGREVAGEVESDWMVPLLVVEESDRLMAWQQGVSL